MNADPPLLEVDDLRVGFEADGDVVEAVDGASFSIARGRTVGLIGESGSGKTVTALTILGLTRGPQARISGRALFEGRDLIGLDDEGIRAIRGDGIAMVFQDPLASFHPLHRVGRQVAEAIHAHQVVSRAAGRRRAIELLELVRVPEAARRFDAYPHELSGGLRQRAMIAMALANEPSLLIADEPTSALDVTTQAQILRLIARLQADLGMAVVLITHDVRVVAEVADDVVVMHAGTVVERGPVDRVLGSPSHPQTERLLGPTLAPGRRGRPLRSEATSPAPLLAVDGLVKHFPVKSGVLLARRTSTVRALDGVSFTVREGETLGLVGESGSGKSTLCRCVLRLLEPSAGSVRFRGREIAGASWREMRPLRREMQMIFQDPYASLNPRKRVGRIVGDPLRVHRLASGAELRRAVGGLLGRVGLSSALADRFPHELSGGQRQRIGIARALALSPKLIVADEPVSALDLPVQAEIVELFRDLRDDLGLACVFVAHDLDVACRVADRIAVMHRGEIVELGPAETVLSRPTHPYTRSLLAAIPGQGGGPA